MADPADIRAGLAANLSTVSDNCTGYLLDTVTPPAFEIEPDDTDYDQAFNRGLDIQRWIVRGLVGTVSNLGAQKLLDQWRNTDVKDALETDRTLGGAVQNLQVTSATRPRQYTFGSLSYLGAEWNVTVYVTG